MKASDGARGHEYRWREWFVRIFGWDCGYFLTPSAFGHRIYARWVIGPKHDRWFGFSIGRDEDGEWECNVGIGTLFSLQSALPEYRRPEEPSDG